MLKYNLDKIFKMRGINNPVQFLVSKGYSKDNAYRIVKGIAKNLQLYQMQDFCLWFNCTPNDLLEWTPDKQEDLATSPALMQLMPIKIEDFAQLAKDIPMNKVPEFMKKIEELKKGM
ncbi:MAG: helix-turn-helix transcriptional regulator [Ignavibacteriaceae bacterium]|jgi:DNA-binding Xre family transcriptional regulator|nr:helix-turn-helix transcriptional regulator [Ignavibacteriaceae bacterium]